MQTILITPEFIAATERLIRYYCDDSGETNHFFENGCPEDHPYWGVRELTTFISGFQRVLEEEHEVSWYYRAPDHIEDGVYAGEYWRFDDGETIVTVCCESTGQWRIWTHLTGGSEAGPITGQGTVVTLTEAGGYMTEQERWILRKLQGNEHP